MSEDIATEALLEFLDGCEAGIAAAKRLIRKGKGISEEPAWSWDPTRIKWEQVEGSRGIYERSEDINNPDFKALLKDLAEHQGRLSRDGYFYWAFQNGATVGRKKRKQS
jgi:hypothetical protein